MARTNQIKWIEPYRVTVRSNFNELRSLGPAKPWFWFRVIAFTTVVAVGLILCFRWAYPGAALPWVKMLLTPVVGAFVMKLQFALGCLMPRTIKVSASRVAIVTNSTRILHAEPPKGKRGDLLRRLISIETTRDDDGQWWLIVQSRSPKGRVSEATFAIARKVDLDRLEALLEQRRPPTDTIPIHSLDRPN